MQNLLHYFPLLLAKLKMKFGLTAEICIVLKQFIELMGLFKIATCFYPTLKITYQTVTTS